MISYSNMKSSIRNIVLKRLLEGVCEEDLEHICALYRYHKRCANCDHQLFFEEMKDAGFFSNRSEEDEFKELPSETKTFYYLEFKKFKPYISK